MIHAWQLDVLFVFSVHLKPEHLESFFITDLYKVQGGDVLGLKAMIADSQIYLDHAFCVGNGWIWKPLLFSRQVLAISVCWLVAQTSSASWLVSRLNGNSRMRGMDNQSYMGPDGKSELSLFPLCQKLSPSACKVHQQTSVLQSHQCPCCFQHRVPCGPTTALLWTCSISASRLHHN